MSRHDQFARFHRQMLLPGIGQAGQQRIRDASALLVGCGALGTVIADSLTRAGIGRLVIIDRDIVEQTNLQRQILFDERDVEEAMPKAEAARRKLQQINRDVEIIAQVDDFNPQNAESFIDGTDLLLDGLDNFETRYLLNDLAVRYGLPYIYGGAVGTAGMTMTVLPHPCHRDAPGRGKVSWTEAESTPCLRCVFPEAPPPGVSPTCDTAGVLGPVAGMIALHQAAEAIKLLTGHTCAVDRSLRSIDLWSNEQRRFEFASPDALRNSCPCCGEGRFEFLDRRAASTAMSMCGRNAVQVMPPPGRANGHAGSLDLDALKARLVAHGRFEYNGLLLRGEFSTERNSRGESIELLVFPNGRAVIRGTDEPERARSIYARYIGS